MKKKPNVVIFLTDDQRYNTIHALGNKQIITPNMDRLVQMGTAFTQAHIPGGTIGAVCMPSRAMINSGRTLFHIEREGQNIPKEHKTIGECLKEQDYYCFGTGKWHNGPPVFTRSFDAGDNIFFGGMWDHWNVPTNYYDPTGEYDNVINFVADFRYHNKVEEVHCDKFNPGIHSSTLLTDTCIKFLKDYKEDKPFFLYDAYLAPHDPRTMPPEYLAMYNPDEIELPENYMDEHPFDFGVRDIRDEVLAPYPRTKEEVRRQLAEYYGMITHLDYEIGRVMKAIEDRGELENTIFVLMGDNGLGMGCHGLFGKQNHYEHSIRIPLVLAGPGIPQNETRDQYVYLLDLFPTLCDLLNIPIPASVEGKSFMKAILDSQAITRETLYFAYSNLMRSVKDKRYKLIEYRNGIKRTQLFDLKNDPNEMHDLYGQEGTEEIIKGLRELMQKYRKEWNDESHPLGKQYWDAY